MLSAQAQQYASLTHNKPMYPVKVYYANLQNFKRLALELGLMGDEKAGVPRTAYQGIVQFNYRAVRSHR